jgi:glycosyltransferase domain-containing protein
MTPRLTIVLPLKGRYLFTLRFLWHANKAQLPYRFLIADGQVHPVLAELLENSAEHFPNLDIEYIRYPDDVDFSYYFAKMADVLTRVTTPYAMLVDNDDFLVSGGIERALDFLEANADHVCCGGRVAGFSVYSGLDNPSRGVRGRLNRLYTYFCPDGVTSPLAVERLREGSLRLWIYYAVIRTEALATVCREVAEIDFSDLQLFEAFHVMRVLTLGNARADGAVVSYIRQYGTSLNTSFKEDWVHHIIRSQFTSDVHALVERIAANAAAADGADPATLAEVVRGILDVKFRQFLWATYNSLQKFKWVLREKAPGLVRALQNRPHYFIGRERTALLRQLASAGASEQNIRRFRAELAEIEDVLSDDAFGAFLRPYLQSLGEAEGP